jgi:uncharacterized iron-regulated protein
MKPSRLAAYALLALASLSSGIAASAQDSIYLLGEVHDNPKAHAQRFRFIEQLLAKGFKPVVAMEQFDRDKQEALDRAMASCKDADCVIEEAGGAGWAWDFYKPVIDTALKRRLRIVAANVSSPDAMKIAREGLAAVISPQTLHDFKLDLPLDNALFSKHKEAIDMGHCHMLPASAFKGMVNAQVARDMWMAKTIHENASHGVILLAGNSHVRKDIGVHHWLASDERKRTQAIAYTEDEGDAGDSELFDRIIRVEPFERDDPCKAFTRATPVQT